jgi:hypothetical protein
MQRWRKARRFQGTSGFSKHIHHAFSFLYIEMSKSHFCIFIEMSNFSHHGCASYLPFSEFHRGRGAIVGSGIYYVIATR